MTERDGPRAGSRGVEAVADSQGRPAIPARDRADVVEPLVHPLPGETPGDPEKEALVVESARRPAALQPDLPTLERPRSTPPVPVGTGSGAGVAA